MTKARPMTHFTIYSATKLELTRNIKSDTEWLNIKAITTTGEWIEIDIFANDPKVDHCIISAKIEEGGAK